MGIKEEPSFIKGERNPIFGTVNIVKNSEMPIVHDFRHEHFWVIDEVVGNLTNIKCSCGKGKTLDEALTVENGLIVSKAGRS